MMNQIQGLNRYNMLTGSSSSHNSYDPRAPQMSDALQSKRLRGSSARSRFSTETCEDTFEAFPLVFTDQQLAIVGECNVPSCSHNNYDPKAPQRYTAVVFNFSNSA